MKTLIIFAMSTTVCLSAFALAAAAAEDRTCRPSLSNLWKCPNVDEGPASNDPRKATARKRTTTVDRTCRPSLSNLWKCPDADEGAASNDTRKATPRKRTTTGDRTCRPSLSNGYKCPDTSAPSGRPTDAGQFTSERQAKAQCGDDTVVWVNTRSKIYHFRRTWYYGNTRYGAYMCETDSVGAGMRAAKNETHP
jgi:hypothetical protein